MTCEAQDTRAGLEPRSFDARDEVQRAAFSGPLSGTESRTQAVRVCTPQPARIGRDSVRPRLGHRRNPRLFGGIAFRLQAARYAKGDFHQDRRGSRRVSRMARGLPIKNLPNVWQFFGKIRSFSAVSAPIFASKYVFYSMFQNL